MRIDSRVGSVLALVLVALAPFGCAKVEETASPVSDVQPLYDYPLDTELRLDHVQTKSTHNSYHVEPPQNDLLAWDYTNLPLDRQFEELGVRHIELDLHLEGGVFNVFHLKLIDDHTTCASLVECLTAVKTWSDAHRGHHPIVVQLELKDESTGAQEAFFDELHREILSVWPLHRIVTPAFVKGTHASIAEALKEGWPTLGLTRGKVLFTMDEHAELQRAYTHDHKDLEGRLLFPDSEAGDPFAAIMVANDPIGDALRIAKGLAAHMLVRTRADSDGVEAAADDVTTRDAALAVGAHFVSTDYPAARDSTSYVVTIPGGMPSRCNPVTAPNNCTPKHIENPSQLLTP